MESGASLEAQAATGDRSAFSGLMTATKGDLHRFVRRYVGDDEEAYDLVQETYASAWFAIRRYDPGRSFATWIRAIAVNKCRDWGRKRTVRRAVRGVMGLDAPEAMAVGDGAAAAEERLDEDRRRAALDRAISILPANLKAPLLLSALEGRSHAEIALIVGATPKAVETRVARARAKLAEAFRQL